MEPVLDLNDVRIFVAMVDGGSMSSAAKTLSLPTSTVSRSIARLQKRLGIALIRSIKSGTVLTDAGSEYLPSCREALTLLQEGQTTLTRHTEQPIGTLHVACPVAMARDVSAPLMPSLSMRHPALRVEILPYTPGPNMSSNQDSDLFFHVVPPGKQTGYMRSFPATRRGIYTSKKYARVAGTPETPEELASFQCLGSRGVPALAQWHLRNEIREVKLDLEFNYMAADPYTLRNLL